MAGSSNPTILTTERLVLRRLSVDHAEAYAAMNADPAVAEFLARTLSRAESNLLLKRNVDHWRAHGFGLFAVEASGAFVGTAGVKYPPFEASFTPAVEIGWRFASAHWGQGYATEAARAALAHAVDVLCVSPIVSFTAPANVRSRRVMEKLGLVHDPAHDFDHPELPPGDRRRRHVLYRYVG